jgi:hypothetical protein
MVVDVRVDSHLSAHARQQAAIGTRQFHPELSARISAEGHSKHVQVNQIRQTLNRRTEAEQLLALLTTNPAMYEMLPQQHNRRYSVVELLHGAASAVADVDNATESEWSCNDAKPGDAQPNDAQPDDAYNARPHDAQPDAIAYI